MIKVDIVNNVAERTGVSKVKAEEAVEALFEAMKAALQRGERIELRGFGVFVVKPRKRGVGRNPRTGEKVYVAEKYVVTFKPGKEMEEKVRQLEEQAARAAQQPTSSPVPASVASEPMPVVAESTT